jgi:hypothetical protein
MYLGPCTHGVSNLMNGYESVEADNDRLIRLGTDSF